MTLFEKYGGLPTVQVVVNSFYVYVLANPKLRPYFAAVDQQRLIIHQIAFIAQLLGRPVFHMDSNGMREAHAGLQISEVAYLEVLRILKKVLGQHGVEPDDMETIMGIVDSFKPCIVELPLIVRKA